MEQRRTKTAKKEKDAIEDGRVCPGAATWRTL